MIDQGAVLVTGAAVGIGRSIAEAFARIGDSVIVADIDVEGAERTAGHFVVQGWDATAVGMDVTDVPQVRAVMAQLDAARPLRAVVANAGVAFQKPTEDVEPEEFDRLMAVNVRGVFFVMQAALRCMLPRESGSIVAISSTSGFTASTGRMVAYDASKAAVRMLVSATAKEVASSGVRVNAVAPGTVATDLTRALASPDQLAQLATTRVPMGRLGLPSEIGDACVFLASDSASYVTGHTLVVDGGWLA